jgi:hypothetical protein
MNPAPHTAHRSLSLTPFCGDLRSKKLYMVDQIPTEPEHVYDPSGHCWCYHTQLPVGPDGQHAYPEACGPERGCYRSALSRPTPPPSNFA